MDFDELLSFTNSDYIDTALVFPTDYSAIVNLAHGENVTLRHNSVKNLKCKCIDQIQHLLLCTDE